VTLGKVFAECPIKVLGKEVIADVQFAELSLSSATLGKEFAECFSGFAECFRHSTKILIPVVFIILSLVLIKSIKERALILPIII
jgi:hypothetical protein